MSFHKKKRKKKHPKLLLHQQRGESKHVHGRQLLIQLVRTCLCHILFKLVQHQIMPFCWVSYCTTTSWFWMTACSLVLSSDDLSGEFFFLFLWATTLWWQQCKSSLKKIPSQLLHCCSVMSVIICADALMTNRLGERGATAWHRSKSAACAWTGWFTPRQKPDRKVASRAKADRRLDRLCNAPPRFHMSTQDRAGMQVTACS